MNPIKSYNFCDQWQKQLVASKLQTSILDTLKKALGAKKSNPSKANLSAEKFKILRKTENAKTTYSSSKKLTTETNK